MTTTTNGTRTRTDDELFSETPRRKEVAMTIAVIYDGFPVEINVTASIDQLPAITARLREVGAVPPAQNAHQSAQEAPGAAQPAQPARNTLTGIEIGADGVPVCPEHGPMTKARYGGWYCPARGGRAQNARGYCASRLEG